ncbi:MAG: UbiA family prenyltransferase [Microvirga sp.]
MALSSTEERFAATDAALPLCVDLDGTLVRTDLLHEAAIRFIARNPWTAWRLGIWALKGPAVLKSELSTRIDIGARSLPYFDELIAYIVQHREQSGSTYLVTASPRPWAEAVAGHLGLFDEVICSSDSVNLKGEAKVRVLADRFGSRGFAYIGDSRHDAPVWAKAAVPIGVGRRAARYLPADGQLFTMSGSLGKSMFRAMRPHQWLKNLLVFVPLLTSHQLDNPAAVLMALVAFAAFCCCASSAYIVNDLIDLPADRAHPRKCLRPFASGEVPIALGGVLALGLLVLAALCCLLLPPLFAVMLLTYYCLTQAYSLTLKRRAPADIFTLAGLYTIRVVAGAAAIGVQLSLWLAALSVFVFLSLATLKRYAELVDTAAREIEVPAGRGYMTGDGPVLVALGVASGFSTVLVLTQYVTQHYVVSLYRTPALLWLICPLFLFWISRMWLLAQRHQMHDDPIVLTVRDRISQVIIAISGVIAAIASAVEIPLPMILE